MVLVCPHSIFVFITRIDSSKGLEHIHETHILRGIAGSYWPRPRATSLTPHGSRSGVHFAIFLTSIPSEPHLGTNEKALSFAEKQQNLVPCVQQMRGHAGEKSSKTARTPLRPRKEFASLVRMTNRNFGHKLHLAGSGNTITLGETVLHRGKCDKGSVVRMLKFLVYASPSSPTRLGLQTECKQESSDCRRSEKLRCSGF